jgi:hypothetical protein
MGPKPVWPCGDCKVVNSMPTAPYRSPKFVWAIGVALILAAVAIYLAPKSIPMPLGLPAHEPIARRASQTSSELPPGGMQLLPGYTHTRIQGVDTSLGRIVRLGGPAISYEIGGFRYPIMQGVDGDHTVLWTKSQKVYADAWMEGRTLSAGDLGMVMRNDGRLDIDTGLANFTSQRVRTTEDLADVLLMAVTLDAEGLNRELGLGIKWTYAPAPRAMKLLPGYVHTPRTSINAEAGHITKPGGPDVSYQIGEGRAGSGR